jgi:predicted nucleic acid-binding protein
MKLFFDANVLFTAAYSATGIARAFFDLEETGYCILFTSNYALEEARRNIALKAPDILPVLELLSQHISIVPEPRPDEVQLALSLPLPLKDAPIMAAAVSGCVDILVTGDRRDFGHLFGKNVKGVLVLSPREALEAVLSK